MMMMIICSYCIHCCSDILLMMVFVDLFISFDIIHCWIFILLIHAEYIVLLTVSVLFIDCIHTVLWYLYIVILFWYIFYIGNHCILSLFIRCCILNDVIDGILFYIKILFLWSMTDYRDDIRDDIVLTLLILMWWHWKFGIDVVVDEIFYIVEVIFYRYSFCCWHCCWWLLLYSIVIHLLLILCSIDILLYLWLLLH